MWLTTDQVTKYIPWSTFHFEGPERVVICILFPRLTSLFHVCQAWTVAHRIAARQGRTRDTSLLSNVFSFKAAKTNYPSFSKYFSIIGSQLQAHQGGIFQYILLDIFLSSIDILTLTLTLHNNLSIHSAWYFSVLNRHFNLDTNPAQQSFNTFCLIFFCPQ